MYWVIFLITTTRERERDAVVALLIKLLLWTRSAALDECRRECGSVTVPHPFGIKDPNCFKNQQFELTCNDSGTPSVLYYSNVPILNISVQEATATVNSFTAYDCYFQSGYTSQSMSMFDFTDSPFTFSATRNKFTATGCDTSAMMVGSKGEPYGSGCMSLCNSPVDMTAEGSCSGIGCCQTQLPTGVQLLNISLSSFTNHSGTLDLYPCSFAFLADQSWFNFSTFNLSVYLEEFKNSQVVLDWVVENKKCESAQSSRNPSSYACGPNSDCLDSDNWYRCKCKEGYKGNPYLKVIMCNKVLL